MVNWPPGVPGPSRCTINNVTFLKTSKEIDLAKWEIGVQNLVYREPNLRTDVDLTSDPVSWTPATDFSEIFCFKDCRDLGYSTLRDAWSLAEDEANKPWNYGSGKPLFRSMLLRVLEGYIMMNIYHHAAGDGTSGMIMATSLVENYDTLLSGGSLKQKVNKPLPAMEDLNAHVKSDTVLKSLVDAKVERAKSYKPYTPFDLEDMAANHSESVPSNLTLHYEGSDENLSAIKVRCKKEGVTLNNLALSASYLAMAAVHAESTISSENNMDTYQGISGQLIDVPVNMRHRVDPSMAGKHAGFIITEITTSADVKLETKLWALAKELGQQVKTMLDNQAHFIFSEAKVLFETGADTQDLAESVALHDVGDVLVSNMMGWNGHTLDYAWASIESVHCVGSYWAPGFANYLILFQSTKHMNYDVCYCKGAKTQEVAQKLLKYFVEILEQSHAAPEDYNLKSFMESLRK